MSDSRSHLLRIGKTLDFNIKIEVFYRRDAELAFYAKYCVPFMFHGETAVMSFKIINLLKPRN